MEARSGTGTSRSSENTDRRNAKAAFLHKREVGHSICDCDPLRLAPPQHPHIAPRSNAPVIRRQDTSQQGSSSTSNEQVVIQTMKWGLVPHWSKHEDKTLKFQTLRRMRLDAYQSFHQLVK